MARKASVILSHWHQLIEGLQESPQQIYSQMEQAINSRKLPGVKILRISYKEAGVLSAKREYLRVVRNEYIFDICAAPFGTGFFVSWWLGTRRKLSKKQVLLLWLLPPIGLLAWLSSRRETFYTLDTAMMFRDSVHTAVMEVVDKVVDAKGLRQLTEEQKKPILKDILSR